MNHIDLTVADLEAERTRLDEMIAVLKKFSAARFTTEELTPAPRKYIVRAKPDAVRARKLEIAPSVETQEQNGQQAEPALRVDEEGNATRFPGIPDYTKATTVSGALKQIMLANIEKPMTSRELEVAVKTQYPELAGKTKLENIAANLYYWESKLNVVKVGSGALATWKVNKIDFFKQLVED